MPEIDSYGGLSNADAAVAAIQSDVAALESDVTTAQANLTALEVVIDELNAGDYYTKAETDALLSPKATTTALALKADVTSLASYVPVTRSITTSGLATGGGVLSADQTITVPKASGAEAIAGLDDAKAITPYAAELKRVGHPRVHGMIKFTGTSGGAASRATTGFSFLRYSAGSYTIYFPTAGTADYAVSISTSGAVVPMLQASPTATEFSFRLTKSDDIGNFQDATTITVTVTL